MRILITLTFALFYIQYSTSGQDLPMDGTFSYEEKADRLYDKMAYTKATKYYEKSLAKSPDDTALKLKLARCYVALNDQEKVQQYYDQTIADKQATDQDILNYAEALSSNESYDKSDQWFSVYQERNTSDNRTSNKKKGINDLDAFYEDSIAYLVQLSDFNSDQADFAPIYYDDQTLFVSNRGKQGVFQPIDNRNEKTFLDVYKLENEKVSLFEAINDNLNEGPMTFFDEGNKVLITTNHKESKGNKDRSKAVKLRLVIYELTDEGWKYESDFPHNDPAYSIGHPSYDESSHTLYYSSNQSGGQGGVDIYSCKYANGEWLAPKNIESINTEGDEVFPFISPAQDLYFASTGWGGLGGLDLYKTSVVSAKNTVYNLGYPVNSPKDDFGLVLDKSGKKGYLSSNRENGIGDDDIYNLTIYRTRVESKLVDETTGELLEGTITIVDKRTGEQVPFEQVDGTAIFDGMKGRAYTITVEKEGYESTTMEVLVDTNEPYLAVNVPIGKSSMEGEPAEVPVEPVVVSKVEDAKAPEALTVVKLANLSKTDGYHITSSKLGKVAHTTLGSVDVEIGNVYFQFDSDEISSGYEELQKLSDLLIKYESLQLEVNAHCDAFGPVEYNDQLAAKRANKIIDILVQKGVEANRIAPVHLGERQLLHPCESPEDCAKEKHQQHRRAEFILKR